MKQTKKILISLFAACILFGVLALAGCEYNTDHQHDLVSHEAKAPTCTDIGWNAYQTCKTCDYTTYKELSALGHKYGDNYEPNGDVHSRFCDRCDSSLDVVHNWLFDSNVKAATCILDGVALYKCSVCNLTKTEKVEKTGHTYSDEYVIDANNHSMECEHCSHTVVLPHEWKAVSEQKSTCEDSGLITYNCSVCGAEKSEATDPLGHDYVAPFTPNGDVHSMTCSRCSSTADEQHSWSKVKVISEPNCNTPGSELHRCSVCNAEKTVTLDPTGEHIDGEWKVVREPGVAVSGLKVLYCAVCKAAINEVSLPSVAEETLPVLYFVGDYTAATKDKNEVNVEVRYVNPNGEEFSAYAKIKVQGSSSAAYAKKNYTVKLYKDETYDKKLKYDFGWGKENKYVIKANWVDFSQARNVVSCRLWGDIVSSRAASDNQKRLAALKTNGGAIDGFPISVFMNGVFHGLYTLNVPKDEWMFGMEDSETEALIAADNWNSTCFRSFIGKFSEIANGDIMSTDGGWELRYCGSEDYSWVAKSFDALISFVQNNDGEAFKQGISQHLDVDAAIDYFIFMYANCMHDNASKNMLWATYDGKTWIPSVYDQDGTFGQVWDGKRLEEPEDYLPKVSNGKLDVNITYGPSIIPKGEPYFILWDKLLNNFTEEIIERYYELRKTTLSTKNMIAELKVFDDAIPESLYEAEIERWKAERKSWYSDWDYTKYHFEYMYDWVDQRMQKYDQAIENIASFVGYSPK